ncbi:MAG: hypothetical protein PHG88_08615 [Limnochordia bacterium]|nr:hypothetical protein [Limnochordia bacterium]HOQ72830.1 hypothetical protein [Limnochordia bacterium]HPU64257.1 hypothetical protein [Limnochordia bacterium]
MLKNCELCGKLFAHPARTLCEDCYGKVQESYEAVKEYLQKHPGASVAEVAQATETEVDTIYQFIREGRLSIIPKDVSLTCEICGAPITTGRICRKCRAELAQTAPKETQPGTKRPVDDSRVRYLDQIKRRR